VGLNMLEREVGLTGKKPEQSAPVPTANAAWVETQTMVDQPEGSMPLPRKPVTGWRIMRPLAEEIVRGWSQAGGTF
jgi:hypothetical protein